MTRYKRVTDSLKPTEQYGYHEHKAESRQRGTEASARVRHEAAEKRRQERETEPVGTGESDTGSTPEGIPPARNLPSRQQECTRVPKSYA